MRRSSHQNFLIVMHPRYVSQALITSTIKAPILSRLMRPTPTSKITDGDFGTHIFLDLWGLVVIGTQIFLFAKFKIFNLSNQSFAR